MGTGRVAIAVSVIVVVAIAVVGLLYWLNFRDYAAFGFIGCVALFACVYLIGLRTPR